MKNFFAMIHTYVLYWTISMKICSKIYRNSAPIKTLWKVINQGGMIIGQVWKTITTYGQQCKFENAPIRGPNGTSPVIDKITYSSSITLKNLLANEYETSIVLRCPKNELIVKEFGCNLKLWGLGESQYSFICPKLTQYWTLPISDQIRGNRSDRLCNWSEVNSTTLKTYLAKWRMNECKNHQLDKLPKGQTISPTITFTRYLVRTAHV